MNPKRTLNRTSITAVLIAFAALFFCGANAYAEPPATPPGATEPATPPAPTPASGEQAPKPLARKEDTDPTTLADAKSSLKSARTERDTAEAERAQAVSERDSARAENTRLAEQFRLATEAATAAQSERDTARTERATAISERDIAKAALATADGTVSRLEQLCKVKGVSPSAAVPLVTGTEGQTSLAEFQRRSAEAKTPAAAAAVAAEFEKAVKEGTVSFDK